MKTSTKQPCLRYGSGVLLLVCILAGCVKSPTITVTIKPAASEEEGDTAEAVTAAPAGYGTVTGTIKFVGNVPPLPDLVMANDQSVKDPSICAAQAVPDESLVINRENGGLANVVILLDAVKVIKPELKAIPKEPEIFDQKGCKFIPHLVIVRAGQPLNILSADAIPHNTHTMPARNNAFNQTIPPETRSGIPCNYTKAENAPVQVVCDLHAWMKAYHFPVDHPYVAKTDENGQFKIEGVPAGKQRFKIWHERGKFVEARVEVEVVADGETKIDREYGADKLALKTNTSGERRITLSQLLNRQGQP